MNEKNNREEIIEMLLYLGIYKIDEKQLFELSTSVLKNELENHKEN